MERLHRTRLRKKRRSPDHRSSYLLLLTEPDKSALYLPWSAFKLRPYTAPARTRHSCGAAIIPAAAHLERYIAMATTARSSSDLTLEALNAANQSARRYIETIGDRQACAPSADAVANLSKFHEPFPEHGVDAEHDCCDARSSRRASDDRKHGAALFLGFVIGGSLPAALAASWIVQCVGSKRLHARDVSGRFGAGRNCAAGVDLRSAYIFRQIAQGGIVTAYRRR